MLTLPNFAIGRQGVPKLGGNEMEGRRGCRRCYG